MKKKNLLILLLIPFLIPLIGIVTINSTFNLVENDIIAIKWDYKEIEAFKISDTAYALVAEGLNPKNSAVADGNDLVWTAENKNSDDTEPHAEIVSSDNGYYLKAISAGEVVVTCCNQKGNVFKKMTVIIYENSVIIVQPTVASSQSNIDNTIYYGLYDLNGTTKEKAVIDLDITIIPASMENQVEIKSATSNLQIDLESKKVYLQDVGDASFTIGFSNDTIATSATYRVNYTFKCNSKE